MDALIYPFMYYTNNLPKLKTSPIICLLNNGGLSLYVETNIPELVSTFFLPTITYYIVLIPSLQL